MSIEKKISYIPVHVLFSINKEKNQKEDKFFLSTKQQKRIRLEIGYRYEFPSDPCFLRRRHFEDIHLDLNKSDN